MVKHYLKKLSTGLGKYIVMNFKKIFILIFVLSFVYSNRAFPEEMRNPFKNWFPVIKIESQKEEPTIFVEPEKTFNASLYSVEGLFWSINKPKAIINNQIYSIGDKLGESEITKIDKDGVAVIFNDKEYVITTYKPIAISSNEINGNETETGETK